MSGNEYGSVLSVETVNLGTVFAADAIVGATTLALTDASIFNELGGQVYIDGQTYYYQSVDLAANTMLLLTGLVSAATADETQVEIFPPAPVRTALVDFPIEEAEAVRVTIPHFFSGMPDGIRPVGSEEIALIEERESGELYLKDVATKGMNLLGPGEDLDNYTSQGVFIQLYSADAQAGVNYPAPYAGVLEVLSTTPSDVMIQRYTAYRISGDAHYPNPWVRSFGAGSWSPWKYQSGDTLLARIKSTGTLAVDSTAWTVVPGMSATLNFQAGATYEYTMTVDVSRNSTDNPCRVAFYVDSSVLADSMNIVVYEVSNLTHPDRLTMSLTDWISGLSSGSHLVEVRAAHDSGGTTSWTINAGRLLIKRI